MISFSDLKRDENIKRLVEEKPDAYAKYINYTPYMGGDFRGYTFIFDSNGNLKFVGYPSPQGLLGKARWLARVAVASFLDSPKSYKEVEEAFSIEVNGRRLGVIEYLFGSVEKGWASPISVQLRYKVLCEKPWHVTEECYKRKKENKKIKCPNNRYNDLLIRSDINEGTYRNMPLAPSCLQIEVSIFKTPRFKENELFKVFAATVLLTPFLLGLGKASTRGFGRFKPEEVKSDENVNSLLILCKDGKIEDCISEYLGLWEEILKSLGHKDANLRVGWIRGYVPSLSSTLDNNYGVYISGQHPDIDNAMKRIGKSVLKMTWKDRVPSRGSGGNLHTWPLGLPRQAQRTGYLPYRNRLKICGPHENIYPLWKDKVLDSIKANNLRRQSPFVLFPLPDNRIVLLPLPAYDFDLGISNERNQRYSVILHHVGKHGSLYHVIPVREIITTNKAVFIRSKKAKCKVQGGVLDPEGNQRSNVSYEEILKVTYTWLKTLISEVDDS